MILTSQNGGAEQVFIDYSLVLKKLGHEVTAIIKNDAPYGGEVASIVDAVKKTTNRFGFYDFIAVKNIKNFLQEEKIDVVFAHGGRSVFLARQAIAKIKNKKIFLIAVNHSTNVKRSLGSDIILSVNKTIFFRTIDAGQSENSSFVIHNAIGLEDAPLAAPALNLPEKESIILGVVGRLDEGKGFDHAIRALAKLNKISHKKFFLKIAGSGAHEAALRKLAKELALEDKIEFCGWIKDKKSFFAAIDLLVFPTLKETFGLVLLEAMKYCKPIISTNADGPQEILRDKIDALLIDIKPLETMAERIVQAVVKMTSEKDLAEKLVKNSFTRLKEKFSFKSLEARLKEIVGSLG